MRHDPYALEQKKECDNPRCYRIVGTGVMYCCKACGDAHEGGYKLGPPGFWPGMMSHSPMCDRRAYEGDWLLEAPEQTEAERNEKLKSLQRDLICAAFGVPVSLLCDKGEAE